MRIAIPVEDGKLFGHFGGAPSFALIDTDEETGAITAREDIEAPPHEPGLLPKWLSERGVELVMTGGIGPAARNLLAKRGIEVLTGVVADTPEALVAARHAGTLETGVNDCDHEHEDGHEHGHGHGHGHGHHHHH
jgi:ATP-binding protein involved in chromosome partitioning